MKYGFEQNKENWIVNAQHVLTTIGLSYTEKKGGGRVRHSDWALRLSPYEIQ